MTISLEQRLVSEWRAIVNAMYTGVDGNHYMAQNIQISQETIIQNDKWLILSLKSRIFFVLIYTVVALLENLLSIQIIQ